MRFLNKIRITPPFYRNCWKLLPVSYYWYHFRKWLHWEFGLHKYEPLDHNIVWCRFCGGKSETFRKI